MSLLSRLMQHMARIFCEHECAMGDIKRLSPEEVVCACRKCGKVLHAAYGLALPARLVR